MANYDPYDRDREYTRRYVREERPSSRYLDPRDPRDYGKTYSRDLVPRAREDSDLSVEEIRRDFPPPSGRDMRRARSAEPNYYEEYEYHRGPSARRERDRHHEGRPGRQSREDSYYDDEERRPKKGVSKQEKIIGAVAGAALLASMKELYDRREAKTGHHRVERNPLSTAALAGVGAFAAYQGAEFYNKQQQKKDLKTTYILHRGRNGQVQEYFSSDDEEAPKEKKGHKNFLESAIAATGLGAAVKSFTGGDDHHSDSRSAHGSRGSSKSRNSGAQKIQKAAVAALLTGATEAFRVAKEPGSWKGEKAKRVLTAAAGAATVDAAHGDKHGKLGLAESVIGGLVGNRLINGSRNDIEMDQATGRSRSRSRARSGSRGRGAGLAALATAGLGALGAKKVLDHSRSRSRGRSVDSRDASPDQRNRSRSRSVVDRARSGLAKLGIGSGVDENRRRDQDDYSDRGSRSMSRRYSDDGYGDGYGYGGGRDRYEQDNRSYRGGQQRDRSRSGRSQTSESDLGDSDEDEKRARKMKGKQLLTSGLAAVATVHAAHEVYQGVEKRKARKKAVREGRLSPAEAKKLKTKSLMQDAAAVGIAAMGIKGAIEEMKEAKEMKHECNEWMEEKAKRHERREQRRQKALSQGNGSDRSKSRGMSRSQSRNGYDGRYDGRYDGYESEDDYEPRYRDGNPYAAAAPLPAPPIGGRAR